MMLRSIYVRGFRHYNEWDQIWKEATIGEFFVMTLFQQNVNPIIFEAFLNSISDGKTALSKSEKIKLE
jgi:hypothetical protein